MQKFILLPLLFLLSLVLAEPVYLQTNSANFNSLHQAVKTNKISNQYFGSLVYDLGNNKVLNKYLNKDNYGFTYYTARLDVNRSVLQHLQKIDESTAHALEQAIPTSNLIKVRPLLNYVLSYLSCPKVKGIY